MTRSPFPHLVPDTPPSGAERMRRLRVELATNVREMEDAALHSLEQAANETLAAAEYAQSEPLKYWFKRLGNALLDECRSIEAMRQRSRS